MLNNFIYAQTKDLFLEALNAGNILDEAIVFIEDTKEIWNHGHYFGGGDNAQVANIISQISQITTTLDTKATKSELSDYAKTSAIPTKVSQLTNDSNYLTQTQADELYIALSQLELINNSLSQLNTAINKKLDADTASSTYALKTDLDNKQDKIADLDDIRSNAEKGATAVQPDDLTNINEALNAHNTAITNLQNVGAEANVQSDWNATTGDAFIKNKPDLSVYLKSSDAEDTYATQTTVSDLDTKVGGIETAFDNYKTSVSETYLTKNDASTTYAKSGASYTKQESDEKYLTSDALTPYATDKELSALSTTVTTLSGTVSTNTENIGKVSGRVEVIEDYFNGADDADNALNKWHEITDFLNSIEETDDLTSMLANKADKTALDATNASVANVDAKFDSYLPKSGGTITAAKTQPLVINSTSSDGAVELRLQKNGVLKADIGHDDRHGVYIYDEISKCFMGINTDGTPYYYNDGRKSLLHSGNIGGYNAGSADVIAKTYANENINYANNESKIRLIKSTVSNSTELGFPDRYTSGISVMTDYTGWQMVTYGSIGNPNPFFRLFGDDGRRSEWRQLAFLTDNVASATKLQTKRTIWGQEFDGTANISGALTGVSSITMTGNIKMGDATISYDSTQKCIKFSF